MRRWAAAALQPERCVGCRQATGFVANDDEQDKAVVGTTDSGAGHTHLNDSATQLCVAVQHRVRSDPQHLPHLRIAAEQGLRLPKRLRQQTQSRAAPPRTRAYKGAQMVAPMRARIRHAVQRKKLQWTGTGKRRMKAASGRATAQPNGKCRGTRGAMPIPGRARIPLDPTRVFARRWRALHSTALDDECGRHDQTARGLWRGGTARRKAARNEGSQLFVGS
jgi:hypothetical protein